MIQVLKIVFRWWERFFARAKLGWKLSRLENNFGTCAERYLFVCQKSKYKCQNVHKIDFMYTVLLNHSIHSQQCIKIFFNAFYPSSKCSSVKKFIFSPITQYPRHMNEKTHFMYRIVQKYFNVSLITLISRFQIIIRHRICYGIFQRSIIFRVLRFFRKP